MRKKTKKQTSAVTEIARFGNFLIKKIGDGQNLYLRVMSVDGTWRMDFRNDSLKYGWIISCLADGKDGVMKALESWIVLSYHMANVWPDIQFMEDGIKLFQQLQERVRRNNESREPDKNSE